MPLWLTSPRQCPDFRQPRPSLPLSFRVFRGLYAEILPFPVIRVHSATMLLQKPRMQRKLISLVAVVTLLGAAIQLWWRTERDPGTAFLPERAPAEWIVYPKPAYGNSQAAAELPAVFRRSLVLKQVPASVKVQVRACRRFVLSINGHEASSVSASKHWKTQETFDITSLLNPGTNLVSVTVFNRFGPPALWLNIQAEGIILESDESWESSYAGAVWRPAQLAKESPRVAKGNPLSGGEKTFASLKACWPSLAAMILACAAVAVLGPPWLQKLEGRPLIRSWNWTADPASLLFSVIALLWIVLMTHNLGLLPRMVGFDCEGHLDYINYIQKYWALPLADQGWEMYQPPLYYAAAAVILKVFGLSVGSFDGLVLLRLFSLAIGLAHIGIIFATLRLLFPRQPAKQCVGLVIAGFTPMQVYLAHYVTNETLAACLMAATVYLIVRVLQTERPTRGLYLSLGLVLGLALLTKVTALLLIPFVAAALAYGWWKNKPQNGGGSTLAALACLATCGWHYWRVWRHFGNPLITNWDPRLAITWWQDPGYRTTGYFWHFGRSLTEPFLSGFSSLPDGIYSTMWGDGFWGGIAVRAFRPAWNYDFMAVGYLLALLPTILVLIGLSLSIRKALRQSEPIWLLLAGFSLTLVWAIVQLNLTVPSYAAAKAFYGISAMVAISAFAVIGWDHLKSRMPQATILLSACLAIWAMTSYASFWIQENSPITQANLGRGFLKEGNTSAAFVHLLNALRLDPGNVSASTVVSDTLAQRGRLDQAAELAERNVKEHPDNALCHLSLAFVLEKEGKMEAAVEQTARAVESAPDDPNMRVQLATRLSQSGRQEETILACREGLRVCPTDPELHFLLARALMAQAARQGPCPGCSGEEPLWAGLETNSLAANEILIAEAINHFRFVLMLAPKTPQAFNDLAWILSTHSNPALRNGPEAVRLALKGCGLTDFHDPVLLDTLAAAYAEMGRYELALKTARKSAMILTATRDGPAQERTTELIDAFRARQPYRPGKRVSTLPSNMLDASKGS